MARPDKPPLGRSVLGTWTFLRYLPNTLSISRACFGAIAALLAPRGEQLLLLFVGAALTDLADGWLARRFAWHTNIGASLDLVCDGVYFLGALVALWETRLLPWSWLILVLAGAVPEVLAQFLVWRRGGLAGSFGRPINKVLGGYSYLFVLAVAASWNLTSAACCQVALQLASNGGDFVLALTRRID